MSAPGNERATLSIAVDMRSKASLTVGRSDLAVPSENKASMDALKQRDPQNLLEMLDLLADGARRH